jgi:hypothetical protein
MNTGGQSYANKAVNLAISILYLYCTELSFITGPLLCDPAHLPLEAYVDRCGPESDQSTKLPLCWEWFSNPELVQGSSRYLWLSERED